MSRNREPDLIQFRIECVFDDEPPVEKFFMALNARDAISYPFTEEKTGDSLPEGT